MILKRYKHVKIMKNSVINHYTSTIKLPSAVNSAFGYVWQTCNALHLENFVPTFAGASPLFLENNQQKRVIMVCLSFWNSLDIRCWYSGNVWTPLPPPYSHPLNPIQTGGGRGGGGGAFGDRAKTRFW